MNYIILIGILVSAVLIMPTSAKLLPPEQYAENTCELIAREYQAVYGGDLIWIQPIAPNGAWILGKYSAHIINKVYSKELGVYYIDYKTQTYMNSTKDAIAWYVWTTLSPSNYSAKLYDINAGEHPPFAIRWNY